MKRRLLISILTLFICTSCNEGSSLLISSSTNSMFNSLMEKYQYGFVTMPDGIYRIESKLNYHSVYNRTGIVNSVAILEFNNSVVTKLNQHYEGSIYNRGGDQDALYDGNVYFDGITKYSDESRIIKDMYKEQIRYSKSCFKFELNELSFFGNVDTTYLCGKVFADWRKSFLFTKLYDKTRIQLQGINNVVVEGNSAKCVDTDEFELLVYTNKVFFDENLDYFKEEIVYCSDPLDAVFTFQRLDSFVYRTIENEDDYIVRIDPDNDSKRVYIL